MEYIGLDQHKSQATFEVLNDMGKPKERFSVKGSWKTVIRCLEKRSEPFALCVEASAGIGPLYDALKNIAERVVVAHPGKVRLIFQAKRKNDRVDAGKLAKLLYLDEVPEAYIPTAAVRSWRASIEYRRRLLKKRTGIKNSIRALLRSCGIEGPKRLWSRAGMTWLRDVPFPSALDRMRRAGLLAELAVAEEQLTAVTRELDAIARRDARVMLLMTIPGVGPRTAEAFVAYVDKPERFRRLASVGDYFGLVPCQDQSAGMNRLGHLTKEGPAVVRWLLTEAAWQGIRRSPRLLRFYERVRKGQPQRRKIAAVATARHLAEVMASMWKRGEPWSEEIRRAAPLRRAS